MKTKTSVWIYKNEQGEIYTVRVVRGSDVTEIPVSNTEEKTVRRTMRSLFGRCEFTVVQVLP